MYILWCATIIAPQKKKKKLRERSWIAFTKVSTNLLKGCRYIFM